MGARVSLIAIAPQMIGPESIDGNENNVALGFRFIVEQRIKPKRKIMRSPFGDEIHPHIFLVIGQVYGMLRRGKCSFFLMGRRRCEEKKLFFSCIQILHQRLDLLSVDSNTNPLSIWLY